LAVRVFHDKVEMPWLVHVVEERECGAIDKNAHGGDYAGAPDD
jgi:hypothetical protein